MIPRFQGGNELKGIEFHRFFRSALLLLAFLTACTSLPLGVPPTETGTVGAPTASALPSATPTPSIYPWTDESAVMNGLCFESVYDAVGRTFVIQSDAELTAFYDLADNSDLCRRPVERKRFDFTGGRLLIGLWSRTIGCTARHEVTNIQRDDVARIYAISLRLVAELGCNYELVRPFWIGLSDLSGYDVRLLVQG